MAYNNPEQLKAEMRTLEKAFKKGKISKELYESQIKEIKEKLNQSICESMVRECAVKGVTVEKGHYVIPLACSCGWSGNNTYGKVEAEPLGKDMKGRFYFQCPQCFRHLQFSLADGKTRTRKGILGHFKIFT